MAGQVYLQSEPNDRPLSYHELRGSRASLRSPLRSPSPAYRSQKLSFNGGADGASSFSTEDSQRSQLRGDAQHNAVSGAQPVRQLTWPPRGHDIHAKIKLAEAEALVSKGAPVFKGLALQAPNVSFRHSRFYAFAGMKDGKESLEASCEPSPLIGGMSFALEGPIEKLMPWETLEQPSMTVCFGTLPGTTTMNRWVSLISRHPRQRETNSIIVLRPMPLTTILDRLKFLEHGLDEQPELTEEFLYSQLVYDPEVLANGEADMGQQIAVLVEVLDAPYWIDFSDPEAHVIAAYYDHEDPEVTQLFFHQLMLGVELHLRIEGAHFDDFEKHRFLSRLPDRVAWSVALTRIWVANVSTKQAKHTQFESSWDFLPLIQVIPHDKLARIKEVEQLGWALKWPNMAKVCDLLDRETKGETTLESSSFEAKSFLSGVILPGPSSAWLSMRCLINVDIKDGHKLNGLSFMHPQTGFQYRNAMYWYWSSIVGKVLGAAKGVNQYGGWIGPCLYAPDLERVHCVIAIPDAVPTRLSKQKIKNMAARSDPLGSPDAIIPVDDFDVVRPAHDVVDTIRVEKLACPLERISRKSPSDEPSIFNVAIKFAIEGATFALRLRHDTSYIKAIPCNGPHVLFWDYAFTSIRVDGLLDQQCWGGVDATLPFTATTFDRASKPGPSDPHKGYDTYDNEAVLVVEAFGVADNEVFARAWCSYIGLSAVVANIDETCMACAIREAYAACVTVVILIDGRKGEDVEAIEHSPPRARKSHSRMPTH